MADYLEHHCTRRSHERNCFFFFLPSSTPPLSSFPLPLLTCVSPLLERRGQEGRGEREEIHNHVDKQATLLCVRYCHPLIVCALLLCARRMRTGVCVPLLALLLTLRLSKRKEKGGGKKRERGEERDVTWRHWQRHPHHRPAGGCISKALSCRVRP
jgi:hypothetical protein